MWGIWWGLKRLGRDGERACRANEFVLEEAIMEYTTGTKIFISHCSINFLNK